MPSFEQVRDDKRSFAEATKLIHNETNPHNARRLVQWHDRQAIVVNPPALPVSQAAMDQIYGLPYTRRPHPKYTEPIPAYAMIKDSVTIMRGCFGGCTFCSITAHQGRIIQSRSKASVLAEVRGMTGEKDFTGVVSDLGGPTANMYRNEMHAAGSRGYLPAPVLRLPDHLQAAGYRSRPADPADERGAADSRDQESTRGQRDPHGSGSPLADVLRELVRHHVGGRLKVAPEHTDPHVLDKMRKPSQDDFEKFTDTFNAESLKAGKKQYLVPYFIASHPGSDLNAMIDLAVFLKRNGYRPDQVQDFIPAPFDVATAMYYTGIDPFSKQPVHVARDLRDRKLQRALMQFFKPENYFAVREALGQAGRQDLIGQRLRLPHSIRAAPRGVQSAPKGRRQPLAWRSCSSDLRRQEEETHPQRIPPSAQPRVSPGPETGGACCSAAEEKTTWPAIARRLSGRRQRFRLGWEGGVTSACSRARSRRRLRIRPCRAKAAEFPRLRAVGPLPPPAAPFADFPNSWEFGCTQLRSWTPAGQLS